MTPQECANAFGDAAARAGSIGPVLTDFSHHMKGSIKQNFISGGRPVAWAPVESHPGHRSVLIDSGALYDSATAIPEGSTDVVLVAGGNGQRPAKAPSLQYGANFAAKQRGGKFVSKRTRKNYSNAAVTLPARPYLIFQDADLDYLGKILPEYVFILSASAPIRPNAGIF
jgi:phage gpG-like protein